MPMRLNENEAVQAQIEEAERNKHNQEVKEAQRHIRETAQKQWKTINQTANLFATQQDNLLTLK